MPVMSFPGKANDREKARYGQRLKKVDAHIVEPEEYEEIPELTEADFARGVWHVGGKPVMRGRPKSAAPKRQVTLRLDPDVIDGMRATGPGWQTRVNDALRKWLQRQRQGVLKQARTQDDP